MPRSTGQLLPRDLTRTYPRIVRGEGVSVYDAEGKRYLDAALSVSYAMIRSSHSEVST
jgi:4-aminobutyrate aminotransferase-like enzyme